MKKGSLALAYSLERRGAPRNSIAKWAAAHYGGCETSWRAWINDPAKMRISTLRALKLSDSEILKVIGEE